MSVDRAKEPITRPIMIVEFFGESTITATSGNSRSRRSLRAFEFSIVFGLESKNVFPKGCVTTFLRLFSFDYSSIWLLELKRFVGGWPWAGTSASPILFLVRPLWSSPFLSISPPPSPFTIQHRSVVPLHNCYCYSLISQSEQWEEHSLYLYPSERILLLQHAPAPLANIVLFWCSHYNSDCRFQFQFHWNVVTRWPRPGTIQLQFPLLT